MEGNPVLIVDVRIPFSRLVALLIKLSLAAIPAAIILGIVYAVLTFSFWYLSPFLFR